MIIDDDPFILDLLKDKLEQYFPEVGVLGVAHSGEEGMQLINQTGPNLVFLDVEMTDMTGFEMLSKLNEITFKTIFITSYKHYAIKAIRFNALDYLIKPFDLDELGNAIKRYKKNQDDNIAVALTNQNTQNVFDQILTLNTQEGKLEIPLSEIIYLKGDRNYSFIYLKNKKKKLVSKTLSHMEELLEEKGFFRCHKSFIINKQCIAADPKSFSVRMVNHEEIPIARRKKESFLNWLDI